MPTSLGRMHGLPRSRQSLRIAKRKAITVTDQAAPTGLTPREFSRLAGLPDHTRVNRICRNRPDLAVRVPQAFGTAGFRFVITDVEGMHAAVKASQVRKPPRRSPEGQPPSLGTAHAGA